MRIREIDLARGFTVFIMAPVHAVLIYSTAGVHRSAIGVVLACLAEGPGAPLFMTLMGISFVLSSRNSLAQSADRAWRLMLLAYLLNTLKFIVPLFLGLIPVKLLTDYGIASGSRGYIQLFGLGDILQLAAISLVVLAMVYRLPHYPFWAMLLAGMIALVAPWLWKIHNLPGLWGYPGTLLWGNAPLEFFPLFPWLVFPLAGLFLGYFLKKGHRVFHTLLFAGGLLLIGGICIKSFSGLPGSLDFYRMDTADTTIHLGIVGIWLYLCHICIKHIHPNRVLDGLSYLSRHITRIYMIQWVVVFWLLGCIGYATLGIPGSLVCIGLINVPVLAVSLLFDRISRQTIPVPA